MMENDAQLIERFRQDPEGGYDELLRRFTRMMLHMIGRFMRDPDETMEVYTSICERLRGDDFRALRRFNPGSELTPWLSVVVANACRDRFRRQRATSVPLSVLKKLDERERLVFRYYFQEHLAHEDISEVVTHQHGVLCTPLEVLRAVEKINGLLSAKKRWFLLTALNANRAHLSIEELREVGIQPAVTRPAELDEALRRKESVGRLNEALDRLPNEDRLMVLLRFEHGMSAPQIAKVMGYENHKYVYTHLRTIIGQLRRSLDEA